jgi:dsDNA-specific endonuclease/ATPase MutS2
VSLPSTKDLVATHHRPRPGSVRDTRYNASPIRDRGATPDYNNEQLLRLRSDYRLCHEVDKALEQLGNKSLSAEVAQYRGMTDGMQQIQREIRDKEDELYCLANTNRKSVRRLAEAHALMRIAKEEMISNGLMVITPWVMERGHSS